MRVTKRLDIWSHDHKLLLSNIHSSDLSVFESSSKILISALQFNSLQWRNRREEVDVFVQRSAHSLCFVHNRITLFQSLNCNSLWIILGERLKSVVRMVESLFVGEKRDKLHFRFEWKEWFPFPERNGSGPNSTALQCRDDPWHGSEWTRVIPADVQKSAWKSLAPMGPAPAFKPTRTDTTHWS